MKSQNQSVLFDAMSGSERSPSTRVLTAVLLFLTLLFLGATIYLTYTLGARVNTETIPFDSDEADHAIAGLEVYTALKRGDLELLKSSIYRQSYYPPLHSLPVSLSYLLTDPTLAASRLPSVVFFATFPLVLFLACWRAVAFRREARWVAWLSGLSAAAFSLTSPIVIIHSVLCMLEPMGVLLVAIFIYWTCGIDDRKELGKAKFFGLALFAFLSAFTKYNFGIIVIAALLACLFFKTAASWKIRIKESSTAFLFVALVLCTWLVFTDHNSALRFVVGHGTSGAIFSERNLLFYPKAWISDYALSGELAYLIIVLAVFAAVRFWNIFPIRLAFFIAFFSLLVLTISTVIAKRHLMIGAPAVFFLAGVGLGAMVSALHQMLQKRQMAISFLILCFAGFFILAAWGRSPSLQREISRIFEGQRSYADMQNFLVENVDPNFPIITNGSFGEFGVQAMRWKLAASSGLAYSEVRLDSYPYRKIMFLRSRERNRHIDHPWTVPDFPKKRFTDVVKQGYYRYAVQIRNRANIYYGGLSAKEFRDALSNYAAVYQSETNWTIVIYDLSTPVAGSRPVSAADPEKKP